MQRWFSISPHTCTSLREDPFQLMCPDGLGCLFREELSKFKWAFPCFGGSSVTHTPGNLKKFARFPRWRRRHPCILHPLKKWCFGEIKYKNTSGECRVSQMLSRFMATQDMAQINKPIVSQIFSYLDFKCVSLCLEILTRLSLSF